MDEEKSGKQLAVFTAVFLGGLLLVTAIMIMHDPFFQYHRPFSRFRYTINNQDYQNPGMAKSFEYDSIIVGSSMTGNFDTDYFDETTGLKTVKLTLNGALPKDCADYMKLVRDRKEPVQRVYWALDIHTFAREAEESDHEIQTYLYDRNPLNDAAYLFNKEILFQYSLGHHENTNPTDAYKFGNAGVFNREKVLREYRCPAQQEIREKTFCREQVIANLEENILPYVREMKDTEFYFFFPPYSMLYWNSQYKDGNLSVRLDDEKYIVETLLQYDNVKIFFFQDEWDIITDLNRYSDLQHYDPEVNTYMTDCFKEERKMLTAENYEEMLALFGDKMEMQAPGYYDSLME